MATNRYSVKVLVEYNFEFESETEAEAHEEGYNYEEYKYRAEVYSIETNLDEEDIYGEEEDEEEAE